MVKRNIDRRTAIACLVGLIGGAGGLGWVIGNGGAGARDAGRRVEARTEGLSPGLPAHWANFSPGEKAILETIHGTVTGLRDVGQGAVIPTVIEQTMTGPAGLDEHKFELVRYVRDLNQYELAPALLAGLVPTNPVALRRWVVVGGLGPMQVAARPHGLPRAVRSRLKAYRTSGVETDPRTLDALDRILATLP